MVAKNESGRSSWAREQLDRLLRRPSSGSSPKRSPQRSRRAERLRQAAWHERLTDPDPVVVLDALADARLEPGLDCSLAASPRDPAVRLAAAAVWPSLDDAARVLLRDDPNGDVAAAASPALACHAFASQADTDDHARIHGIHLTPDERLTVALGTLGRRSADDELEHVGCALTAVEIVLAGLFPDETRLAERAATVAAASLRSVGVLVPLGDERLSPIAVGVRGRDTGMAWQDRLMSLSTPPSRWDWDGSRELAAERAAQEQAAQQHESDERRRRGDPASAFLEAELQARIRRGEYPALWRDRPRQTDRPAPKRRPPGF